MSIRYTVVTTVSLVTHHLSPRRVTTTPLGTRFPTLHSSTLWLIYCIWRRFCFCFPFEECTCPEEELRRSYFPEAAVHPPPQSAESQMSSAQNHLYTNPGVLHWFPHPQILVAFNHKGLFLGPVAWQLLPCVSFTPGSSLRAASPGDMGFVMAEGHHISGSLAFWDGPHSVYLSKKLLF